jgi:hypothetical protein
MASVLRRRFEPFSQACCVVLLALPAAAQDRAWLRQFGSSRGNQDGPVYSASDGAGGVFTGGYTEGVLGGPNAGAADAWLARHDGAGNRLWIRQFGSSSFDYPRHITADGQGGVYLAGITRGDLGGPSAGSWDPWLARHDGAGNLLWIVQFGTSGDDQAQFVAPDGAGGAFVGGVTDGSLGGPNAGAVDAWLARHDGAGNRLWILQLGTSSPDSATSGASDGTGGLFWGGMSLGDLGAPGWDGGSAWLARSDGTGGLTWIRQFGSSESVFVQVTAEDGAGGVFVGGDTTGNFGGPSQGGTDTWLARYDALGNRTWLTQIGTGWEDFPVVAAPDGSGGLFVGGMTGPMFEAKAWFARLDGSGNQLWNRVLDSGTSEITFGLAPDGAGGAFASGYTYGVLGEASFGYLDHWLARYDGAGARVWLQQFGTLDREGAAACAPDGAGGVFVGGTTDDDLAAPNAGGADAWLAQRDADGNASWTVQFGTDADDFLRAAASDGAGGVLVGGSTAGALGAANAGARDAWLARHDGAGNQLWVRQLGTSEDDELAGATPDGAGGVFSAGSTRGSLGGASAGLDDLWLARHDAAGNLLWLVQLGTAAQDIALAAAGDDAGGVYVAGETRGALAGANAGESDAFVARFDGAGGLVWMRQLGTSARDSALALAARAGGGLFVGGTSAGSLGAASAGNSDAWLARLDGNGNQLWLRQFGTPADDGLHALAADRRGGAYAGGDTFGVLATGEVRPDADAWLASYDGSGNRSWLVQLGTMVWGQSSVEAAAPDGAGGVFAAGLTDGQLSLESPSAGGRDAWLARYEVCSAASVTTRNAGANPASLGTSTLPLLGATFTADVDLTTSGHDLAVLYAFDGMLDVTWHGGQHILIGDLYGHGRLYRGVQVGPLASFSLAIPVDPLLCGFRCSLQAVHSGTVVPFALSNALDLVLGQ